MFLSPTSTFATRSGLNAKFLIRQQMTMFLDMSKLWRVGLTDAWKLLHLQKTFDFAQWQYHPEDVPLQGQHFERLGMLLSIHHVLLRNLGPEYLPEWLRTDDQPLPFINGEPLDVLSKASNADLKLICRNLMAWFGEY